VALALTVRLFIRESDHWREHVRGSAPVRVAELFGASLRAATVSALVVSITGLLTWWAINAFIPLLGSLLAADEVRSSGLGGDAARQLGEAWKSQASNSFNIGGLCGSFGTIPLARLLGRRKMFQAYFFYSAVVIFLTFGLALPPQLRLQMLYLVGFGVFGVFSAHVFYLPELFPARLRAFASGSCYNIGRVAAAAGPFLVGSVAAQAGGSSSVIIQTLVWLGMVPLLAALAAPWLVVETRGRELPR
jgi:hypothetical protein